MKKLFAILIPCFILPGVVLGIAYTIKSAIPNPPIRVTVMRGPNDSIKYLNFEIELLSKQNAQLREANIKLTDQNWLLTKENIELRRDTMILNEKIKTLKK
jgi:FtsZ-binding cell division protein ZapB